MVVPRFSRAFFFPRGFIVSVLNVSLSVGLYFLFFETLGRGGNDSVKKRNVAQRNLFTVCNHGERDLLGLTLPCTFGWVHRWGSQQFVSLRSGLFSGVFHAHTYTHIHTHRYRHTSDIFLSIFFLSILSPSVFRLFLNRSFLFASCFPTLRFPVVSSSFFVWIASWFLRGEKAFFVWIASWILRGERVELR